MLDVSILISIRERKTEKKGNRTSSNVVKLPIRSKKIGINCKLKL